MERNAHYALVGLISVMLFMTMIVFGFWLARFQLTRQYDLYDVDFKGPVRGLSVGGEVYFNGIKVGQVAKLSLDRLDPNRVVARIRTSADAPVRVDSVATLEPLGITGVNYIQISAGTVSKALLKDAAPPDAVPVIRSAQGALESLLQGGGDVLTRTVTALDQVNKLMSDRNISNVSATLGDARSIADALAKQRQMFADLDQTIKTVNEAAGHIQKLADTSNEVMDVQARAAVNNLNQATVEIRDAATSTKTLLTRLDGPTTEFAQTGLPRLSSAIEALHDAAISLDRVINDIEQNPQGVIAKPPAVEMKVKP